MSDGINDNTLNNLKEILGDNEEYKSDKLVIITTFTINTVNLSNVIKILKEKAPLTTKEKVSKATANKLEDSETKDREY